MALKFTVKIMFSNISRLSVITQQRSLTLITCAESENQKSEDGNSLAKEIWEWCIERKLWISAAYIPSCNNVEL